MEAVKAVIRHCDAEDSTRWVLVALAFYAQRETNLTWPSDRELQAFTRLSRSSVAAALKRLQRGGEIQRQPRLDGGPRRTFLITPGAGLQLALEVEERPTAHTSSRGERRPDSGHERPAHARAGKEPPEPPNDLTPPTPLAGGSAPQLISALHGSGPARRRRRRDQSPSVTVEACAEHRDLAAEQAWSELEARLSERLGGQWQVWGAHAHPHGLRDGRLVLAINPDLVPWVAPRYGRTLTTLAGIPVTVVGCHMLAVST